MATRTDRVTCVAPPLRASFAVPRPLLMGVSGFAAVLAIWELVAALGLADPVIISRPTLVVRELWLGWTQGDMAAQTLSSVQELAAGYTVAIIVGAATGILMAWYRYVQYSVELPVWLLYSAPLIAFYPLLILWFGLGTPTVVTICFLMAVFPMIVNTFTGIRAADQHLIRCARAFCASRPQLFAHVVLPGAVPIIIAGMRIALGRALVGVVVGELFGANRGLGFVIAQAGAQLETTRVMAAVMVVSLLGVSFTSLLRALEFRLSSWRLGSSDGVKTRAQTNPREALLTRAYFDSGRPQSRY